MFERPQLRNGFERLSAALTVLVALAAALVAQWLVLIGIAGALVVLFTVSPRGGRRHDPSKARATRRTTWTALSLAGVILAGAFQQWGRAGTGLVIAGLLLARPCSDAGWMAPGLRANWTGYALMAGGLGRWALNVMLIGT